MKTESNHSIEPENNTFESQLFASANRLRKQSEMGLSVTDNIPVSPKRTHYWGWVATPVAAIVGLAIGLFIQHPTQPDADFTIPVIASSDNSGHSIIDDDTDYSMLIVM
ncbi:MAG: hypothetical protein IJ776_01880 [Paludibacteraceae bacterium]|nr:hypothetical protein [Paludibacteraceae bacterium]